MKAVSILFLLTLVMGARAVNAAGDYSIEEYNRMLPVWGASWTGGSDSVNGYYPSFYTGFAVRSNDPDRIHIRLGRGNQTRMSVVLDQKTLGDYLFDLAKRYRFYKSMTEGSKPWVNVKPKGRVLPQLDAFNRILESDRYGILPFVERARAGQESAESIYQKSLETLRALNPGRVFLLHLDLVAEFEKWKHDVTALIGSEPSAEAFFKREPDKMVVALNTLLFGRVNIVKQPSAELTAELAAVAEMARKESSSNRPSDEFVRAAARLLMNATAGKYDIQVLENGKWAKPLSCSGASHCVLSYPEFTAVYPTGSVKLQINDKFGNSIPYFRTPGLWSFLNRSNGRGVDNIRDEPYYGWVPKMDYEGEGNGFHNPAVRFTTLSSSIKSQLGIPVEHGTYWSVMRGGVSHGCSRLPVGHVWEMRHSIPVTNDEMTKVLYFGSNPRDFDIYDIDGDGKPEVIGVEYFISYGLKSDTGLGSREGTDFEAAGAKRLEFYQKLYGAKDVFTVEGGKYLFSSPTVSFPSYLDYKKLDVRARFELVGNYPLYEAPYERDKLQFYVPFTTQGLTTEGAGPLSKRLVRLMGRVRGCAPTSDKEACGEAAFDREASELLAEAGKR